MSRSPRERLTEQVREAYPQVAPDLLEPVLRFMTVARETAAGDTDKIMILLVVAVRTALHPDFSTYTTAELKSGEVPILPSLGTNIRSIADSTGMPRETVRRKVGELVDAGWLTRIAGNQIRYTAKAFAGVGPAREALEDMAVRYYEVVRRMTEEG